MTTSRPLRILLTNDDGPPSSKQGHSPFIYPFAKGLQRYLGAKVKIVVPSKQRSWAGKSFVIVDKITGKYFYPDPDSKDATKGQLLDLPLQQRQEEDETPMEMIFLDGTPATCASIALHNLYPPNSFDLLISGPNFGRNTSSSFALSSGTLGAALAGSLSSCPGIALSWGLMEGYKPPKDEFIDAAVETSCRVVQKLYELGWGGGGGGRDKVDVYSVNVPLMPSIVENPQVQWTSMAITGYGRLFKSIHQPSSSSTTATTTRKTKIDDAGPAALPEPTTTSSTTTNSSSKEEEEDVEDESILIKPEHFTNPLQFTFAPDIAHLVNPPIESMKPHEDRTVLHEGFISVTPVRAVFAEATVPKGIEVKEDGFTWKL